MAINKTQLGWMALGGLLCLLGLVLVCKVREGNRLVAQADTSNAIPVVPLMDVAGSDVKPAIALPAPADGNADKFDSKDKGLPTLAMPPSTPALPLSTLTEPVPSETNKGSAAPLMPLGEPTKPLPPLKTDKEERITQQSVPAPLMRAVPALPMALQAPVNVSAPVDPPKPEVYPPSRILSTSPVPTPVPTADPPPVPARTTLPTPAPLLRTEFRTEAGEPPLAPHGGPVQAYHVLHEGETPRDIARRTLGSSERCEDILKLNPTLKADTLLVEGTLVKLPADACLPSDEVEKVKPLPTLRKPTPTRVTVMPLTGTFPCNLDDTHTITLPRAIRQQLGQGDTVLVSPGTDQCLWLTNQGHLDRLAERLEHSQAKEVDVRVFKRLYYAQTEKVTMTADGRVHISDRLAQFAGLHQEVVLVGIDDHFELWDVARWKQYTQQKSAATRPALSEE